MTVQFHAPFSWLQLNLVLGGCLMQSPDPRFLVRRTRRIKNPPYPVQMRSTSHTPRHYPHYPMQDLRDLLLADHAHFTEALFRNEDIGEKRLNFFITLVTAVAAGLVALITAENRLSAEDLKIIGRCAISFLLVVGLLTYLRMLRRDQVTDEYKHTLAFIRRVYAQEISEYRVPCRPTIHQRAWWRTLLRAGYAQTLAVINGILLAALLYLVSEIFLLPIIGGIVLVAILSVPQARRFALEPEPPSGQRGPKQK